MFGSIARVVTRRAWLVIIGWVVVAAGIIGFAPSLASVTNSDQAAFLPARAESARAAAIAQHEFAGRKNAATSVIVINRADHAALTDADIAQVSTLASALNAGKPAAAAGVVFDPRQMVAANRAVAMVAVQFTGAAEALDVRTAVD